MVEHLWIAAWRHLSQHHPHVLETGLDSGQVGQKISRVILSQGLLGSNDSSHCRDRGELYKEGDQEENLKISGGVQGVDEGHVVNRHWT